MLETLTSRSDSADRGAWESATLVSVLHAALVVGVVLASPGEAGPLPPIVIPPLPPFRPVFRDDDSRGRPTLPDPEQFTLTQGLDSLVPRLDTLPVHAVRLSDRIVTARVGAAGPAADSVVSRDVSEERPELLSAPPPEYPSGLRELGLEGRVVVRVVVDTLGRIERESFTVVATSHQALVAPVKRVLQRALFRPGRVGGRAVRVIVEVPFEFKLDR